MSPRVLSKPRGAAVVEDCTVEAGLFATPGRKRRARAVSCMDLRRVVIASHHLGRWVALVLLVGGLARAQESGGITAPRTPFELPVECGTEAEFRTELTRLVGPDVERAWPSTLRITGDATAGYRLTLDVAENRREFEHSDCRVLFRSALVVAAASVQTAEVAPPPPAPVPPPAAVPPTREQPAAEKTDGPTLRATAGAGAGVAVGVVPGATAAFEARLGGELGAFGVVIGGRYFLPRYVEVEGRGVDIQGFGLQVAFRVEPIELLALSAGFDADLLVGKGTAEIEVPLEDSAWTLAPSLELALIPINTRHLSVELAVSGRVAVQRPVFEVTGFRTLYQVPPFGLVSVARGTFHFF